MPSTSTFEGMGMGIFITFVWNTGVHKLAVAINMFSFLSLPLILVGNNKEILNVDSLAQLWYGM